MNSILGWQTIAYACGPTFFDDPPWWVRPNDWWPYYGPLNPYPDTEVVTEIKLTPPPPVDNGDMLSKCEDRLATVRQRKAELAAALKEAEAAEMVLAAGVEAMKKAKVAK